MKTVYLILGAIGSGKSLIADFILSDPIFKNVEYVGSDIYKKKFFDQDSKNKKSGYRCADELAFHRIEQICKSKADFFYEFCPTNSNKIETIKYLLRKYGYTVKAFFIGTENKEINVNRCLLRERGGGDSVSVEKVRNRYDEALIRVIEMADFSHKMYFIDNSAKFILNMEQVIINLDGTSYHKLKIFS